MQGDAKIKRPTTYEFPQYGERCDIELRRTDGLGSGQGSGGFLALAPVERRHICETVARLGNENLKAARVLGIGKTTLYRKLKQYGFGRIADLEPAISNSAAQTKSACDSQEAGRSRARQDEGVRTADCCAELVIVPSVPIDSFIRCSRKLKLTTRLTRITDFF
jgi:transposase